MKVVGLFSGIGGIELGLSRAGHDASLLVENNPAAVAVLKARFPDIQHHDDIRTLKSLPRGTELVAAGFPCQDLSQAGDQRGIEGSQSGLIGEVFRLIKKSKVPNVLLENVPFMLHLARGKALEVITSTFENLGYRWAYRVVDARAFGLPQRRRRVYFLASKDMDPRTVLLVDHKPPPIERERTPDTACGFYWTEGTKGLGWAVDAVPTLKGGSSLGIPSAPAIWLPDGKIITPDIRDAERLQGFRAGWSSPAERVAKPGARWKLVGNAVSVPVLKWIGARLAKPGEFFADGSRPLYQGSKWTTSAWSNGGDEYREHMRSTSLSSEYPKTVRPKSLLDFLNYPGKALSHTAIRGFLSRTEKSSLRFPEGLLDALRSHL